MLGRAGDPRLRRRAALYRGSCGPGGLRNSGVPDAELFWRYACLVPKGGDEVALVGEAHGGCDRGERIVSSPQQNLRAFDPLLHGIAARPHAHCLLKLRLK